MNEMDLHISQMYDKFIGCVTCRHNWIHQPNAFMLKKRGCQAGFKIMEECLLVTTNIKHEDWIDPLVEWIDKGYYRKMSYPYTNWLPAIEFVKKEEFEL